MIVKVIDKSKLIPIDSIDRIVTLSKYRKSILLGSYNTFNRLPANSLVHMTVSTLLKYINDDMVFEYDKENVNYK